MDLQVKLETQHNHRCSILWRLSVLKNTNNYDVVYAKLSLSGRRVAPQATSSFESFAFLSFQSFEKPETFGSTGSARKLFWGEVFWCRFQAEKIPKEKNCWLFIAVPAMTNVWGCFSLVATPNSQVGAHCFPTEAGSFVVGLSSNTGHIPAIDCSWELTKIHHAIGFVLLLTSTLW